MCLKNQLCVADICFSGTACNIEASNCQTELPPRWIVQDRLLLHTTTSCCGINPTLLSKLFTERHSLCKVSRSSLTNAPPFPTRNLGLSAIGRSWSEHPAQVPWTHHLTDYLPSSIHVSAFVRRTTIVYDCQRFDSYAWNFCVSLLILFSAVPEWSPPRGPLTNFNKLGGGGGQSDWGSYFIPKKVTTSEFVYPKKSLLLCKWGSLEESVQ